MDTNENKREPLNDEQEVTEVELNEESDIPADENGEATTEPTPAKPPQR